MYADLSAQAVTMSAVAVYIPCWLSKLFSPEWLTAIGTIGATALALIIALWGEKIGHLVVRPILSLKLHVGRPDSECTKREIAITRAYAGTAYFFRLAIRNRGNAAAQNVQVFLASVKRVIGDNEESVSQFTPMNLLWAYRGNATLPTLLPNMPPVYCDLAHVEEPMPLGTPLPEKGNAVLALDVEFPPNTLGHVLEAGTYHIRLILAAANCRPRFYRLEVMFSGKWYAEESKMFDIGFKMRAL